MRIASIDIGTNTMLLAVVDIDPHGSMSQVENQQRLPRIGRNVDANGNLSVAAFDQAAWILREFRDTAKQLGAEVIVACATSAVRDAANREQFLSYLAKTSGINVQVLSGKEEAYLSYRGALSGLGGLNSTAVVLDVGGGSTEIVGTGVTTESKNVGVVSLQIGSVRITERFFKHDPPRDAELRSAQSFVQDAFLTAGHRLVKSGTVVGVAGTVTTLACLDQQLKKFDTDRVHGYSLSRKKIGSWFETLARLSSREIRMLSDVTEGRADILAAGVLILQEALDVLGSQDVIVTEQGLRQGFALSAWEEKSLKP